MLHYDGVISSVTVIVLRPLRRFSRYPGMVMGRMNRRVPRSLVSAIKFH